MSVYLRFINCLIWISMNMCRATPKDLQTTRFSCDLNLRMCIKPPILLHPRSMQQLISAHPKGAGGPILRLHSTFDMAVGCSTSR